MIKQIKAKINELISAFEQIPDERKNLLLNFSDYIVQKLGEELKVNLIFICTHNSRRSHMSQIWAQAAAEFYNIPSINCFSGGTEATAFNPRAVKTIQKSGFKIQQKDHSVNPVYHVFYSEYCKPLECFSKTYSDKFNPQDNFAAIMTCSDADANCPVVLGAEMRFPIRYDDPKAFDDTEIESKKYQERFDQIGTEMLFVFKSINK